MTEKMDENERRRWTQPRNTRQKQPIRGKNSSRDGAARPNRLQSRHDGNDDEVLRWDGLLQYDAARCLQTLTLGLVACAAFTAVGQWRWFLSAGGALVAAAFSSLFRC
ncbi:hypothetical protein V8C44DRAFT_81704 [Trichoderma aethiopicum]